MTCSSPHPDPFDVTLSISMSQPVVVAKLRALLDPNTGAAIQKNPRCVAPSGIALVVLQVCARARSFLVALCSSLKVASPFSLQLQRACCMTAFADCPGEFYRGLWHAFLLRAPRFTCDSLVCNSAGPSDAAGQGLDRRSRACGAGGQVKQRAGSATVP